MKILNMEIPTWLVLLGVGVIVYELSSNMEEEPQEPTLEGDVMTCAAWQTVDTADGPVVRCMYFEPACKGDKCMTEPAPYPPSIVKMLEEREPRRKPRKTREQEEKELDEEVKSVAQMMAKSANEGIQEAKELYKQVLAHGGLRPPRQASPLEIQDFRQAVPAYLRRKTGTTADDMGTEMGYSDGDELLAAIEAEKLRRVNMPKNRSYYKISDFMPDAERYVLSVQEAA